MNLLAQSFKDRKATIVARSLSSDNLPTDRAREQLKPCEKAESLLRRYKHIRIRLVLAFLGVTSQLGKVNCVLDDVIRACEKPSSRNSLAFQTRQNLRLWSP